MRWISSVVFVFVASTLTGCWAQAISQDRFGGTLKVADTTRASIEEAEEIIVAHCGPDNWRIDGWEEVVVDVEEYEHVDSVYEGYEDEHPAGHDEGGRVTTDKVSGTTEVVETHLYYSCLRPMSPR